jgi:hypothetical protein
LITKALSLAAIGVFSLFALAAQPAKAADAVETFYKGRTVQVLIGFSAGGGYDIYARTLARYMGRHMPGNPTLVAQNMPGAGTLKVANYIYNVAPKDGTVFGTFARGIPMEKLLGRTEGQQFDATKFTWLGSVTDEPSVCVFWAKSGIATWQDMKTKPWKVGGSGVTSDLDIYGMAYGPDGYLYLLTDEDDGALPGRLRGPPRPRPPLRKGAPDEVFSLKHVVKQILYLIVLYRFSQLDQLLILCVIDEEKGRLTFPDPDHQRVPQE